MESLPLVSNASIPIAQNKKLSLLFDAFNDDEYQLIAVLIFSINSSLLFLEYKGKLSFLNR